jgi:hypothetical protein
MSRCVLSFADETNARGVEWLDIRLWRMVECQFAVRERVILG